MKYFKFSCLSIFTILLITSCVDDDNVVPQIPEGDYINGQLVLNEGGTGTVTYISDDKSRIDNSIFQAVNTDDDLGQFVQSMFFHEGLAYIISNGSNFITVVDRFSFEKVGEISGGLEVPRYGTVVNGKAYVTNLATFSSNTDDFVAVINLEDFSVEQTIDIGAVAEQIIGYNSKVYVQNAAFGSGSQISVINSNSLSIDQTIEVGDGLNSIERQGDYLFALSNQQLSRVNTITGNIDQTLDLPDAVNGAQNLQLTDNHIFYTLENKVYKSDYDSEQLSSDEMISYNATSDFGTMYGFNVLDDEVFICDAGDFVSNGFVRIYDLNGNFKEQIEVELAPNGVYPN